MRPYYIDACPGTILPISEVKKGMVFYLIRRDGQRYLGGWMGDVYEAANDGDEKEGLRITSEIYKKVHPGIDGCYAYNEYEEDYTEEEREEITDRVELI